MLTPEEQAKLDKKMEALAEAQEKTREKYIKKRNLDKEGDENWQEYVDKALKGFDEHLEQEYKSTKVMLERELYDRRKGKKSPWITF